jgi:hypothetical protein
MENTVKYVYIFSAGHSGSTLLDLLLGSHSQITSLGEIEHLSKNISLNTKCSCGMNIRECSVWQQVLSTISRKLDVDIFNTPYALNMGLPNPVVIKDKIHSTKRYQYKRRFFNGLRYIALKYSCKIFEPLLSIQYKSIEHTFLVYNAMLNLHKTKMIVDSSKSYLRGIGVYNKSPDNVRVILLTRDGRGVLYSNLKRNSSMCKSVIGWKKYYTRSTTLIRKYVKKEHLLRVKYEDLSEKPSSILKNICNFLNVKYEDKMLDFSGHIHHITNGNNMRFVKSSEIKIDKAWMNKLSEEDYYYFYRKTGNLNRKLGYN